MSKPHLVITNKILWALKKLGLAACLLFLTISGFGLLRRLNMALEANHAVPSLVYLFMALSTVFVIIEAWNALIGRGSE